MGNCGQFASGNEAVVKNDESRLRVWEGRANFVSRICSEWMNDHETSTISLSTSHILQCWELAETTTEGVKY